MRKYKCSKCETSELVKFYPSNPYKCKACLKGADIRRTNGGIPEPFIIPQAVLDKYSGTNLSRVKELREKYI